MQTVASDLAYRTPFPEQRHTLRVIHVLGLTTLVRSYLQCYLKGTKCVRMILPIIEQAFI